MIKPYKKEFAHSYSLGFYPTFELIKYKAGNISAIYFSSDAISSSGYKKICSLIPNDKIIISDNALNKVSDKGNDYVIGVFDKYESVLDPNATHVVLVNPSDMGNLGNIMRSMAAFDYRDLAIITPSCDEFNPKTIRASMGSIFATRIEKFSSFGEYINKYPRPYYPFMLKATKGLKDVGKLVEPFSIVFGNEATGLPDSFLNENAIKIEQSNEVDSLNLTTAVAIALYEVK